MNEKNPTTRPCIVKGTPCKFHGFVQNDELFLTIDAFMKPSEREALANMCRETRSAPNCCDTKVVRKTAAVIEWPDGSVTMEPVEKIRFTDATDRNVGDKADEWIPVERELPIPFVSVLVYMPGQRPCPTVREGFMAKGGTWHAGHYNRKPDEVVAWRPMPEPPEREEVLE